jgi:anaerobic selenocysteine-containing dehydrogenase
MARRFGLADVGSTLEEIRQGIAAEQLHADAAVPAEKPAILPPVESPSLRHLPDRLGWMWRRDTILRHTDDWEREHQDQWLEIHPEDAKALGLRPGWKVRVAGEGGEFQAVFRASERASPGILVSPHDLIEGPVRLERAA